MTENSKEENSIRIHKVLHIILNILEILYKILIVVKTIRDLSF